MAGSPEAIVIGASAGAVEALSTILPTLSERFPLPLMVVVHLPPDRRSAMAALFAAKCLLPVEEACDKQKIVAGTIYFAPPDYHLLIEPDRYFSLSVDDPVMFSRPSIDVFFESAADVYGSGLIGIILTGANADGAKGLKAIAEAGGTGIVQDPSTAYASAMPESAMHLTPSAKAMSLDEIAGFLRDIQ